MYHLNFQLACSHLLTIMETERNGIILCTYPTLWDCCDTDGPFDQHLAVRKDCTYSVPANAKGVKAAPLLLRP